MTISIYSALSFFTAIGIFLTGIFVYRKDPKSAMNRRFMYGSAVVAWWALCEFLYRTAPDSVYAAFWMRMCFAWPLGLTFFLDAIIYFMDADSKIKILPRMLVLYAPAVVIAIIHIFFTWLLFGPPVKMWWGYMVSKGPLLGVINFYLILIFAVLVFWLLVSALKTKDAVKKKHAFVIAAGFFVAAIIAFSTVSQEIFFNRQAPELSTAAILAGMIIIVFGSVKHGVFSVNVKNSEGHIFNVMKEGFALTARDLRIKTVNEYFCLMTGYLMEEVEGMNLGSFAALNPDVKGEFETALKRKDAAPLPVGASHTVVRDNSGNIAGHIFVFSNITDKKRKIEIEAEYKKMIQGEFSKNEIINVIGHEMKTPLTSIKGFSSLLISGAAGKLTDAQREYAATIEANADRLVEMTSDFIDIIRISSGRMPLVKERFDMSAVVDNISNKFNYMLAGSGISVTTDKKSICMVFGDEKRLEQAVSNMVLNAVKFSEDGDAVKVYCSMEAGNSNVLVFVEDAGRKLSAEEVNEIFAGLLIIKDNHSKKKNHGTPFAMTISKAIAESHGGRLFYSDNATQKGNTFIMEIPLS
jgi:signal transduction histidine kinase